MYARFFPAFPATPKRTVPFSQLSQGGRQTGMQAHAHKGDESKDARAREGNDRINVGAASSKDVMVIQMTGSSGTSAFQGKPPV